MPKAFCELEMCAKRLSELCALCERKNLYEVCKQPNRGISVITPLPAGEGLGEGPPPHEIETVRKYALLNL